MLSRIPFLIGSAAGDGDAAVRVSPTVPANVAAKAAPAEVFRNRRLVSLCITLPFLQKLIAAQPLSGCALAHPSTDVSPPREKPHTSFFKSIPGSNTSRDLIISSHEISCPLYAAARANMHEIADSAPLSAWL